MADGLGGSPNDYTISRICAAAEPHQDNFPYPRSELDSHANMVVLGKHCFVFDSVNSKTCEVEPFDPALGTAKHVPIVDAAVAYDCPYTQETYLLIFKNALYVPTMENNLLPPFILREAGITCNDVPKIHLDDPSAEDHAILIQDPTLRIPLQLWGIFSFFHSRVPTSDEIKEKHKIFFTPDSASWDPYSDHYATNEESMLDHEGSMIEYRYRKKHIVDMPPAISVSVATFDKEIDRVINAVNPMTDSDNEFHSMAQLDMSAIASALISRVEISNLGISCGSTTASSGLGCDLFEPQSPTFAHIDDKKAEINAAQGSNPNTVSAEFLSKIWNIKNDQASKVIAQNTHLNRQGADNDLSRQLSTNDRMLRYKRINSQFFTDTFFVTGKGKSTRGNKCAQIFVSDKGFVVIYPMQSKGDFPTALHQFCKEVGVPNSLVVDPSGEQTSNKVKRFCHQVGTSLRLLEESTQWANRAELYIRIFKEAIRKDLRDQNSPMVLWDYCAERRARIHNVTPRDLFQLNDNTPTMATFGTQADISNICQFRWYDWCYFREVGKVQFP